MEKKRLIFPIVSVDWLSNNIGQNNLIILDVRSAAEYETGHIANSISAPFARESIWAVTRNNLTLEVPVIEELQDTISSCGITDDSVVVIVSSKNLPGKPPYELADAARVAVTLIYAGVTDVSLLDGGHSKWVSEGKPVTKSAYQAKKVQYKASENNMIFVDREYVERHVGKSVIVDARNPNIYFGVETEPFADKAGHIPGARSLPAPWIWNQDGTYKDTEVLVGMAQGVIGFSKAKEIIVYCGVGGFTAAWWYVLTQVLGYENVKYYDGSAEDWVRSNFMVSYSWTY